MATMAIRALFAETPVSWRVTMTTQTVYELQQVQTYNSEAFKFKQKTTEAAHDKTVFGTLFASGLEKPEAWGLFDGETLVGGIETALAADRLVVTQLWVQKKYQRQGQATALVAIAKKRVVTDRLRGLVMATTTDNFAAIRFCLSAGFRWNGFDLTRYSNEDAVTNGISVELFLAAEK